MTSSRREVPALDFVSHSAEQTHRLGARLGELLAAGDVLVLSGTLGAGKTVFAQGVAVGLGVDDPVTSPTFTLVHEHQGRLPFYHVDLYRIEGDAEAAGLGLEDYAYGDGVTLVEWGERASRLLPPERLEITFRPIADTKRAVRMAALGERCADLLATFKRTAFGL
jgi:tRNA threonylcarbamoyladenosine biosynthesis protein TsaE